METAKISIHEIIENTISLLKNTINKNISIKTDLSSEYDVIIGDESQVQSTLLNLGIINQDEN